MMDQFVCILGRQPALGIAELESLLGSEALRPIGEAAILVSAKSIPFERLGGCVKAARLLAILDTTDWTEVETHLVNTVALHTDYVPAGKMNIGLSAYGFSVKPSRVNATALSIKKAIQNSGRSVRIIPNKAAVLSSAQILHNDLTGLRGWELLLLNHHNKTYIAQTAHIQDINAYAARDQARPKRDARVGMLPPKLAQIIINLAKPPKDGTVLDPFCGTGVILQEAVLMGFRAIGTDIDQRMIDYTRENVLEWLPSKYPETFGNAGFQNGDATTMTWGQMPRYDFDCIASETYLGRPFSAPPKPETLNKVVKDVDTIHKKFLHNVARQTSPGFRLCSAVPAWKTSSGFRHLPFLDHLEELGYTRLSFVHVRNEDLVYHRPEQIVARELIVLERK